MKFNNAMQNSKGFAVGGPAVQIKEMMLMGGGAV
jgi:hypothetical protein